MRLRAQMPVGNSSTFFAALRCLAWSPAFLSERHLVVCTGPCQTCKLRGGTRQSASHCRKMALGLDCGRLASLLGPADGNTSLQTATWLCRCVWASLLASAQSCLPAVRRTGSGALCLRRSSSGASWVAASSSMSAQRTLTELCRAVGEFG